MDINFCVCCLSTAIRKKILISHKTSLAYVLISHELHNINNFLYNMDNKSLEKTFHYLFW